MTKVGRNKKYMNKLASIELIKEIVPIPNADSIELAKVLGYQAVVKKGEFQVGQKIVFVLPDTVLPDYPWFSEYKKYCKTRIKAVKIRGVWSMGLILPFNILDNYGLLK
jgi:RNA ligase (TIGR02306 family)